MNTATRLAALAATCALLAGCGSTLQAANAETEALDLFAGSGGSYHTLATGGVPAAPRPAERLAARLGLSADQKAQAKAIVLKYRDQLHPVAQVDQLRGELKAILGAPTVDAAALRGFITARVKEVEANKPNRLALAGELRGLLTADQRVKLASLIRNGAPERQARFEGLRAKVRERLIGDMRFSADQTAAVGALRAKIDALRADQGGRAALREAAAKFVETGDANVIATATTGLAAKLPVDEVVAVAVSLDAAQRGKLIAKVERLAAFQRAHAWITR